PFAQSGEIEFVVPEDDEWSPATLNEAEGYWVRITTDADLDLFEIEEVRVHRIPQGNTISGLTAIDSIGAAISIRSASRNTFKDIIIRSSGAEGVRSIQSQKSGRSWANSFINVQIEGSQKNGYFFLNSPQTRIEGGRLSGNLSGIVQFDTLSEGSYYGGGLVIENNRRKGIVIRSDRTTVEDVIVRDNGVDTSARDTDRAGIVVMDGDGSVILNSEIIDDQEQPTQTYGVLVQEGAANTSITENRIEGNAIAPIADFGTDTVISSTP
ncbi:MAG: right-handed parallel beta-helix repeat-containing protein, partial [Chloroflexi bacterium]|nr:right-handed parallel beta-helix repeat-containing protein [Chloroflexota bacterium]